jgi:hypothetical protein
LDYSFCIQASGKENLKDYIDFALKEKKAVNMVLLFLIKKINLLVLQDFTT